MARRAGPSAPSIESLFVATLSLLGLRLGATRIVDNSMLVHLRTGVDMARGRGIAHVDPYTFTAQGHDWVVQSWLPSLTYGWVYRVGAGLVALQQGVLLAVAVWLIARLARTGSALRTLAAGGVAIGVGLGYWSPRPLLFGLVAFALLVTIVERELNPWWLVPVIWVWVNSHGSFPLGVAWLGAVIVGETIDRRSVWPVARLRYAWAVVLGLALAALNPLGPRLLVFPFTVGSKRAVFRTVVEWQSPNFQTTKGLIALTCIAAALIVLTRSRMAWRDAVPVVAFVALGLLSLRNLPLLAVVLAPALGRALRVDEPSVSRATPVFVAVLAAAFIGFGAVAAAGPGVDVSAYPVRAVTWLDDRGYFAGAHRVATQDVVGCYLDFRYGRWGRTFIDDRVDMLPVAVSRDYAKLLTGRGDAVKILERYRVDAVLWESDLPLVKILRAGGQWRVAYRDHDWTVLVRT